MYKPLIYNHDIYLDYEINKKGKIRNSFSKYIYKPYLGKKGYYVVSLPMGKQGKSKVIRVHKALAETFIPNPKPTEYDTVNHIDENKTNNKLSNLEWCTSSENTKKYYKNAYKKNPYANNRKLDKTSIRFIRNHPDYSCGELAKMLRVSKTTIINVRHGVFYKGV